MFRANPNPNPNPKPNPNQAAAKEASEIAEERYLCEVHGQCPHIDGDGKQIKEWDPSTVPVWTPPGVDPDAKGGTVMKPDWDGMDPKSREYACVVHGECGDATAKVVGWDPSTVPEPWTPPAVDEKEAAAEAEAEAARAEGEIERAEEEQVRV